MKASVWIRRIAAWVLAAGLCCCAVSCREETAPGPQDRERVALPEADAGPEEVLRSYLACLQCGDSETYMHLFTSKSAAWAFPPAFQGPQEIRDILVEECAPGENGEKNWKVTYLARVDEEGEWDPEGKQERQICQYPCLVMTGKGWRIETLQGRAGEPRPFSFAVRLPWIG